MNTSPPHCIATRIIASPVGELVILASEVGVTGLYFGHRIERAGLPTDDPSKVSLNAAQKQLGEYFSGKRRSFDLPLDPHGTDFQQSVWAQLRQIPFGETASYGDLAGPQSFLRLTKNSRVPRPLALLTVPCCNNKVSLRYMLPFLGASQRSR